MELKAKKVEYSFTPDDIKKLIAENLGVAEGTVNVDFRIGVKPCIGNPFGPDIKEVTEITGKGQYAQSTHLNKYHDDGLTENGEVRTCIHHSQAGYTDSTC